MSSNKNRKNFGHMVVEGTTYVDYKNVPLMKKYVSIHGRIKPRHYTKVPLVIQKRLARAIKNARFMALIPFTK
ncbi:MAG: 30S ribosomal protein S18 [Candidatus Peregrinibacteria bacterium]|nr:30S ribosomal protein S18 [Candidatus Peregrinibacteria bacterium]